MGQFRYVGNELEVFAHAHSWKSYINEQISEYIHGDVLEVGAGTGNTTKALWRGDLKSWLCLEPDLKLVNQLNRKISDFIQTNCTVVHGDLTILPNGNKFDCILYIDVLEHIQNDKFELEKASLHLKKGGVIIIIAPAHQCLFSPFDASIGHYRRYNKKNIKLIVNNLEIVKLVYLDSVSLIAVLINNLLLKHNYPTKRQIEIWDKKLVTFSRKIDKFLFYKVGKSILAVLRKIT